MLKRIHTKFKANICLTYNMKQTVQETNVIKNKQNNYIEQHMSPSLWDFNTFTNIKTCKIQDHSDEKYRIYFRICFLNTIMQLLFVLSYCNYIYTFRFVKGTINVKTTSWYLFLNVCDFTFNHLLYLFCLNYLIPEKPRTNTLKFMIGN